VTNPKSNTLTAPEATTRPRPPFYDFTLKDAGETTMPEAPDLVCSKYHTLAIWVSSEPEPEPLSIEYNEYEYARGGEVTRRSRNDSTATWFTVVAAGGLG